MKEIKSHKPKQRANGEGSIFQRKSDKLWVGRFPNGKNQNGSIKYIQFTSKNKEDVELWLSDTKNKIDVGFYVDEIKTNELLGFWMEKWLENIKKPVIKNNTFKNYKSYIERFIKPYIGGFKLVELNPLIVNRFYDKLIELGVSNSNIRCIHSILTDSLKNAVENKIISYVNIGNLPKPKLGFESEKTILDKIEIHLINLGYKVKRELNVKYGRIDLFAENKSRNIIVEGKSDNSINKLSSALGQLLLYKECISNAQLYIATPKKPNTTILNELNKYNIKYFDELFGSREEIA